MTERRQREQPLTGSSMTANSSTNSSGLKKSASFSKSREPVQEQFKLSLQPKRKSDTNIITDTNKSLLITSKPINPRASVTNTSDESIRIAIRKKLEQHTKSAFTSLEEIRVIVSSIYDIVGKEVDLALKKAKLQQSGSGAVITGLKVAEHPMSVTVKPIHEETTEVNLAVVPTTSPTPPSTAGERPESTDSVDTNKSPPQTASTQHSVRSEDSGKDIQYSTSSATNRSNENAPVKKTLPLKGPQKAGYVFTDETNLEVTCACQISPLIHNDTLHVLTQSSATDNDELTSYDLFNGQKSKQEVKKSITYTSCKMMYLKDISLLAKSSNAKKLNLYQLDTKSSTKSWKSISRLPIDVKTSAIPVPYKDDGIIIVYVANQQSISQIEFYIFSLSEKPKSASSQIRYNANYQIQSCSILSNCIYCALFVPEGNIYIYKFDIASLRKETNNNQIVPPNWQWSIKNVILQKCFIPVLIESNEIFIISLYIANNKSTMEVKRLLDQEVSSVEYHFEFQQVVKVVTGSVISGTQNPLIVVLYHDDKANKCYIKRVAIFPVGHTHS